MTFDERNAISRAFTGVHDPVAVNIGAYHGEDDQDFRALARGELLHIMVEPDPENCAVIQQGGLNAKRRLFVGAIAVRNEKRNFWRSHDDRHPGVRGSGSLLEPTEHLTHFPHISFCEQLPVECITLDELFVREELARIDLLWCDAQGAESEIISSGQQALAQTRYAFLEADEIAFYRGQSTKTDLLALLPGWELLRDFGYNIFLRNLKAA